MPLKVEIELFMFMSQYPEEHRRVNNQCINFLSVSHLRFQINEGKSVSEGFCYTPR